MIYRSGMLNLLSVFILNINLYFFIRDVYFTSAIVISSNVMNVLYQCGVKSAVYVRFLFTYLQDFVLINDYFLSLDD
jgi:hypothetical protein